MGEDKDVDEDSGIFSDTDANVNPPEPAAVASGSNNGIIKENSTTGAENSLQLTEAPNAIDRPNAADGGTRQTASQGSIA
jgi:hypothetical protein